MGRFRAGRPVLLCISGNGGRGSDSGSGPWISGCDLLGVCDVGQRIGSLGMVVVNAPSEWV